MQKCCHVTFDQRAVTGSFKLSLSLKKAKNEKIESNKSQFQQRAITFCISLFQLLIFSNYLYHFTLNLNAHYQTLTLPVVLKQKSSQVVVFVFLQLKLVTTV